MSLNPSEWFTEVYDGDSAFAVRYTKKLYEARSEFQKIEIFETSKMGRVLILEGCFMVTEKDSFIYHEMLVHPAVSCTENPRKAVVIGGGDGGAVTELVKYNSIESIVLCEIDPQVIESCKKFFPEISAGLSDPRVSIVTRDGAAFIAEHENEFDIVLVDSTDPVGPGAALFATSFFESIRKSLTPAGVAVLQTESPLFMSDVFKDAIRDLRNVFGPDSVNPMLAVIPSYPGGLWSFGFCSETKNPHQSVSFDRLPKDLKYYSPEMHKASIAMPPFVKELLTS